MRKNLGVKTKLLIVAAAGLAISIPAFADTIKTHGKAGEGIASHESVVGDKDSSIMEMSSTRKTAHELVRGMRGGENTGNAKFGLPDAGKARFHPIIVPEGKLNIGGGPITDSTTPLPEPGVLGLLQLGLIGVLSMGTFFRRQKS